MITIRDLTSADLPPLKDFAPPEWNTDISVVFGQHFGQPYFHPIVAEHDGTLVGCADALLQGSAGWLGGIIVLPEYRHQGIGRALTEELVKFLQAKRIAHQVLVATNSGEPIYRKLGFQPVSYYTFFARQGGLPPTGPLSTVRALLPRDEDALFALDKAITGERRAAFLQRYLDGASVHTDPSNRLDGYYLPALGTGLIIAANDAAGLALLRYKVDHGGSVCVVPEQNRVAVDFLRAHGFVETSRAPRMALGGDVAWQPEHVYSRGSGFCG
jgi:ribosomal protein S18 acetylase RimI-like enzyme